jgi:protein-disulfide isomerase
LIFLNVFKARLVLREMAVKKASVKKDSDVWEIPVGKWGDAVKKNPWVLVSVVLAVILIIVLARSGSGAVVSPAAAGDAVVQFVNAQGQGGASLVDVERDGALYLATVSFNGQNVPVHVTLDGKQLVVDPIPLGAGALPNPGASGSAAKVSVDLGDSPVLGQASAEVVIVEFSDYQCPFCAKFASEALLAIEAAYIDTGKVKLVYKDFPLDFHPEAAPAAEAAHCVREQLGDAGYFAMHDKLFVGQRSLGQANYILWASEVGANAGEFAECISSGKFSSTVAADLVAGQQAGVQGTPGFLIGSEAEGFVLVSGAQPFSVFEQVIEDLL